MDANILLSLQNQNELTSIEQTNTYTSRYALSLSKTDIAELTAYRKKSLFDSNRVEFSQGTTEKLIYAFCDSVYIEQKNYKTILIELTDIFYACKSESGELVTDDELIACMRDVFDNLAQGSTDYLESVVMDELCKKLRLSGVQFRLEQSYDGLNIPYQYPYEED